VPDDPNHRAAWERAAGTIEQYRTLHDITDPERALGPQLARRVEPNLAFEQQRVAQQAHQVHELTIVRGIEHSLGL
jgi:hypothetical protein